MVYWVEFQVSLVDWFHVWTLLRADGNLNPLWRWRGEQKGRGLQIQKEVESLEKLKLKIPCSWDWGQKVYFGLFFLSKL